MAVGAGLPDPAVSQRCPWPDKYNNHTSLLLSWKSGLQLGLHEQVCCRHPTPQPAIHLAASGHDLSDMPQMDNSRFLKSNHCAPELSRLPWRLGRKLGMEWCAVLLLGMA